MRVTSFHRPNQYRQSGSPTSGKAPNVASRRDSAARADPAAAIHGSAGFPSLVTGHHHRRRRPRRRLRSIAVAKLASSPRFLRFSQTHLPSSPIIKSLHRDVRELPLGQTSVQALIRRPAASMRTRGCGFAALRLAPVLTSRPCAAPPSHRAIRRSTLVQPTWCHSLPPPLVNVQSQPGISSSASNCTQNVVRQHVSRPLGRFVYGRWSPTAPPSPATKMTGDVENDRKRIPTASANHLHSIPREKGTSRDTNGRKRKDEVDFGRLGLSRGGVKLDANAPWSLVFGLGRRAHNVTAHIRLPSAYASLRLSQYRSGYACEEPAIHRRQSRAR